MDNPEPPEAVDWPLPMHGPMVLGGADYSLDEWADLGEPMTYSTGAGAIDHACDGGLHPGEVWTIAAQSRVGATMLATQLAVAACQNAHMHGAPTSPSSSQRGSTMAIHRRGGGLTTLNVSISATGGIGISV